MKNNLQRLAVISIVTVLVFTDQSSVFNENPSVNHYKKQIHADHQEEIFRINQGGGSHIAGQTKFTHLSRDEFAATYLGGLGHTDPAAVDIAKARDPRRHHGSRLLQTSTNVYIGPGSIPPSTFNINWNGTNATYVTSVKNQGACGSCWSFAGIAQIQSYYLWKHKIYLDLSEQQVVDCVPEIQPSNQGCAGGYLDSVCIYAVRFPIISERIYPYSAVQSVCNKDRVASATPGSYQIKNYNFISDCNTLASTLINLKPIGVCGMIDSKWQTYLGGVINNCTSAIIGGHCVLLVGAVSDGTSTVSTNYWIVKNSWGSNFGEYGFMRLFRDPNDLTQGFCGICKSGIYSQ